MRALRNDVGSGGLDGGRVLDDDVIVKVPDHGPQEPDGETGRAKAFPARDEVEV